MVIALDLSKAFETVRGPPDTQKDILELEVVPTLVRRWTANYLRGRV